jgi:hypothetical protein
MDWIGTADSGFSWLKGDEEWADEETAVRYTFELDASTPVNELACGPCVHPVTLSCPVRVLCVLFVWCREKWRAVGL